jgi:hypothetical protein
MQVIFQFNMAICPIFCENAQPVWKYFPVFDIVYWAYFVIIMIAYRYLAAPYCSVWWLVANRRMTQANTTM